MRICIDKRKGIMVPACAWPKEVQCRGSSPGGKATAKALSFRKDVADVRRYLAINPNATVHDLALCCFLGDDSAEKIIKEIRNENRL